MQVNLNSTDPYQLVYTGTPGMIVNLSTNNRILLGPTQGAVGILTNPVCTPLGPLNSVHVDGTTDVWAIAFAGTPTVAFFPHMDQWSPSPAQVQAQLQPSIVAIAATAIGPATTTLITAPADLRVWGLALSARFGTTAAYVSAANAIDATIQAPTLGGTWLDLSLAVSVANQDVNEAVTLALASPIPVPSGSVINVGCTGGVTNTFSEASASLFYSIP